MSGVVFLEGEKVILRPVSKADLDGPYTSWINDQEADVFTEHALYPNSREALELYVERRAADTSGVWLAIVEKASGKHIGNIELSDIDLTNGLATYAILVGEGKARGRGYAFEASVLLLRHAFSKLNLHRVELGVHEHNEAAGNLYRRLGFVEEGRRRQAFRRGDGYADVIVMAVLAEEFAALHGDTRS